MFNLLEHFKITFDEAQHRYERFGQKVDSVSSVLPYFAGMNEYMQAHPEKIEKAGVRGTNVATFIEKIERDGVESDWVIRDVPIGMPTLETCECQFLRFKHETGFEALKSPTGDIASELFVYHDTLDYVGCLDLAGYAPNCYKGPGLIEVKATAVLPKTIGPQSAAYFEAFNRNAKLYGMPKLQWRASLHLTAKGYKFTPLKDPMDYSRFCSILTTTRWARELGLKLEWSEQDPKRAPSPDSPETVFA